MKARTTILTLLLCLVAGAMCFANDVTMGTWKLNDAKSKIASGMGKNDTVVYEAAGENIKVTVDGTDGAGAATHNEWTGAFDGKDYPVTGDPGADTRSYKRINAHTLEFTDKKDGKPTIVGRIAISTDGKSRTVTIRATDSNGKTVKSTSTYDKQ